MRPRSACLLQELARCWQVGTPAAQAAAPPLPPGMPRSPRSTTPTQRTLEPQVAAMDERAHALGAKVDADRLELGDGEAAVGLQKLGGEQLGVDACLLGWECVQEGGGRRTGERGGKGEWVEGAWITRTHMHKPPSHTHEPTCTSQHACMHTPRCRHAHLAAAWSPRLQCPAARRTLPCSSRSRGRTGCRTRPTPVG